MILNPRGTSGSGKSTLVRKIMELPIWEKTPIHPEGRARPIGYFLSRTIGPPLVVLGHYETECGGVDTISGKGMRDLVFAMVRRASELGCFVLFEGLIVGGERNRTIDLVAGGYPLVVINLTTPIETCLERVWARRLAKGNKAPLNPANTINKKREVDRTCEMCREGGVDVQDLGNDEAFELARELLWL